MSVRTDETQIKKGRKMTPIAYFKLQAKNLNHDIKTQFIDNDADIFDYQARFFDVNGLVLDYDLDETDPKFKTLGKAQWIIALILGLESWTELINSDTTTLELYKKMFEHQNEIPPPEWSDMFILVDANGCLIPEMYPLSPKEKLEYFQVKLQLFKEQGGFPCVGQGYLIMKNHQ